MVTGTGPLVGNNVSHANNKTKRRFMPSVKTTRLYSEALGRMISVKLSVRGQRSIEHKGGLDAYLMGTAPSKLDPSLRPIKTQVAGKSTAKPAAKRKSVLKTKSARATKAAAVNKKAAK
jgi:large subunit ribosomal protein L28